MARVNNTKTVIKSIEVRCNKKEGLGKQEVYFKLNNRKIGPTVELKKGQSKVIPLNVPLTDNARLEGWDADKGLRGADDCYGSTTLKVPVRPGITRDSCNMSVKKGQITVFWTIEKTADAVKSPVKPPVIRDPRPPIHGGGPQPVPPTVPAPPAGGGAPKGRLQLLNIKRGDVGGQRDAGQILRVNIGSRVVWTGRVLENQSVPLNKEAVFLKSAEFSVYEDDPRDVRNKEMLLEKSVSLRDLGMKDQAAILQSKEGHRYILTYDVDPA